jgi:non-homologous end joining protein Ku
MDTEFSPSKHKDEYQVRLRALIEQKIAGKELSRQHPS